MLRSVALLVLSLLACRPAGFQPPTDSAALPIADRPWATGAPAEGWCGEASLQMAALHFGAWLPQAAINRAGHPKTPDLWEQDVPVALDALGLAYDTGPHEGTARLLRFTIDALRRGRPVVLGVKLVPSEHPEWHVDHLVLAVGFSPDGLLINTNMEDGQVRAAWSGLLDEAGAEELSLVNRQGTTWGWAVRGFEGDGVRARLEVLSETAAQVRLRVELSGLTPGEHYELSDGMSFVAQAVREVRELTAPAEAVTRVRARPGR